MIKIGIIGCGLVVQKNYIKILPKLPGINIQYVYDINNENSKSAAELFNAEVIPVDEMLKFVDYVLVATPPSTHYNIVKEAISNNVHVICEKPFVTTIKEAKDLVQSSLAKNSKVYVAHFRRNYPSVQLAKKFITTGILGTLKKIIVIEGGRFNWDVKSDYVFSDIYGGVLYDTGSHTLDMALFASNLDDVACSIKIHEVNKDKSEPSHEIKSNFEIIANYGKIDCFLYLSRHNILANKIKIEGDNGYIEFSVAMQNKIRYTGPNGSVLLFAEKEYKGGLDCASALYSQIFNMNNDEFFKAERFINLIDIFEKIISFK